MQFVDLKKQYSLIKPEIDKAIQGVLDRAHFILGEETEKFEQEMAKFCGVKYAIGVNSGTDAIFLALKTLGIGSGDEVITTPFTFIATAEVVANLGAKPVFADINPQTFNIDPSKIEKAITKKTKAIIPVHLFGQMADMDRIMAIAKKYKLFVVEDAAQAIGAMYKSEIRNPKSETNSKFQIQNSKQEWKIAGSIGDIGCFSFFPSKNLGAFGDGGMAVTNDEKLAEKLRLLRNHGSSPKEKYLNLILGINSRLDAIQAAILRVKLEYLKHWTQGRQKIAQIYNQELGKIKGITIPNIQYPISPEAEQVRYGAGNIQYPNSHIFHQYTIRVDRQVRNKLISYLKENGIPTMIYYPLPLHFQPAFRYLKYKKGALPETERVAQEVLSLPIYPELNKKEIIKICRIIKRFYLETK